MGDLSMPAKPTRCTLLRQWEILKLLPTIGSGKSTSQIRTKLVEAGYSVSKRQIERDLWLLYEVFSLECNDKSVPYGWKLINKLNLPDIRDRVRGVIE
jgi:hypothetical protein